MVESWSVAVPRDRKIYDEPLRERHRNVCPVQALRTPLAYALFMIQLDSDFI